MICFKHTQSETDWHSEPRVPTTQLEQSLQALILFQAAPLSYFHPLPDKYAHFLNWNFFFLIWTIFNAFLN